MAAGVWRRKTSASGITRQTAATTTSAAVQRHEYVLAIQASSGRKSSWPLAFEAVRRPLTRPRRVANQVFAMIAASGTASAPVAEPTTTPQSR